MPGYLGTNPALVKVDVTDSVVRLAGELERKSMLALLPPAGRAVDGVIDVEGQLGYAIDDTGPAHRPEPGTVRSPLAAHRLI